MAASRTLLLSSVQSRCNGCMHSRLRLEFMSNCEQLSHYSEIIVGSCRITSDLQYRKSATPREVDFYGSGLKAIHSSRGSPRHFRPSPPGSHPVDCSWNAALCMLKELV